MDKARFSETVFSLGSTDRAYLEGDMVTFMEDDAERVVKLMLDVGGEDLTIVFDAYHLREFRLAVQRAEAWVNE
jgi:hypothetical protein